MKEREKERKSAISTNTTPGPQGHACSSQHKTIDQLATEFQRNENLSQKN